MQIVSTNDLVPGMKVAVDVYTYSNQLIIPKDTLLTDKMITRLEFYSIPFVKITDDELKKPAAPEYIIPADYTQRLKKSPEFKEFKNNFFDNVDSYKDVFSAIIKKEQEVDTDHLLNNVKTLIGAGKGTNVFDMLHNMRQYDDATYVHSLNVSLMCSVFGSWLKLPKPDIDILTLAGLLHDIGKAKLPEDIIKKSRHLTEQEIEIIHMHPLQGYNLIKDQDIDDRIKKTVLMHHERCDGSGYPFKLTGQKIHPFAKIVAIADVYDAMTSARVYRGPLSPFQVVAIFESEGLQQYDTGYVLTFLEQIINTFIHCRVVLSDGTEGTVVLVNRFNLSKPIIKTDSNTCIDLSKEKDLSIISFA